MNLTEINCPMENGVPLLLDNDHSFSTKLDVPCDNYYDVEFEYFHDDWDNWLDITVSYEDGETLNYLPCFPHGGRKLILPMYLKKGENNLLIRHNFGHEFYVYDIKVKGVTDEKSSISPLNQTLFIGEEKTLQLLLKSYNATLIKIESEGKEIGFSENEITLKRFYTGFARHQKSIILNYEDVCSLGAGSHQINLTLSNGEILHQTLNIMQKKDYDMEVVNFNIACSNSTLIKLPNGKYLLIDSSTDTNCEKVIMPYLKKHNIKLSYYLLTHFHSDHWGLKEELLEQHNIKKPSDEVVETLITQDNQKRIDYLENYGYLDSTMLRFYDEIGDIWDLGGLRMTILNSRFDENGNPMSIHDIPYVKYNEHNFENSTSVSLFIKYNGFGYYHGADNYAFSQTRLLEDYKRLGKASEIPCHYYYGNHHFHCDISADFVRSVNPQVVFVSVDESVYSRSTYAHEYIENVENYHYSSKRLADTLLAFEVGTAILHINSADDWCYETKNNADL